MWGQYFKNKSSGEAVLKEDVEWRDVVFREGSFVGGGASWKLSACLPVTVLSRTARVILVPVSVFITWISALISKARSLLTTADTGFHRGDASASAPLPNLGAWYLYSPAKKWLLHARVDWISANIDEYDGTLWNTNVGVNYQLFRNFGLDMSYQYFNLNVGVDNSRLEWRRKDDLQRPGRFPNGQLVSWKKSYMKIPKERLWPHVVS